MSKLLRKIMVVVVMGVISTSAFAQGKGKEDKRPPKEPVKVIDGKRGGGSNRPPQPPPQKPPKEKKKP